MISQRSHESAQRKAPNKTLYLNGSSMRRQNLSPPLLFHLHVISFRRRVMVCPESSLIALRLEPSNARCPHGRPKRRGSRHVIFRRFWLVINHKYYLTMSISPSQRLGESQTTYFLI